MSGIYSTNKIKNLNQLNDVNITDVSNDEVIKYNASTGLWENGVAGVENISELNDVSITTPANDEVLKYNASSGKWENGTAGGGDPYFFKAIIETNQTIRRSGGFGRIALSPSGFRTPYNTSDTDLANNIWTCPSNGVYRITLKLIARSTDDNIRMAQIGLLDDLTWADATGLDYTKLLRYEQYVLTGLQNNGSEDAFASWTWTLYDLIELVAGQTIQVAVRIYTTVAIAPTTFDWSSGLARTDTTGGRNADGAGGEGHLIIEKVA